MESSASLRAGELLADPAREENTLVSSSNMDSGSTGPTADRQATRRSSDGAPPPFNRTRSFKTKQLVRSQAIRETQSPPRVPSPRPPGQVESREKIKILPSVKKKSASMDADDWTSREESDKPEREEKTPVEGSDVDKQGEAKVESFKGSSAKNSVSVDVSGDMKNLGATNKNVWKENKSGDSKKSRKSKRGKSTDKDHSEDARSVDTQDAGERADDATPAEPPLNNNNNSNRSNMNLSAEEATSKILENDKHSSSKDCSVGLDSSKVSVNSNVSLDNKSAPAVGPRSPPSQSPHNLPNEDGKNLTQRPKNPDSSQNKTIHNISTKDTRQNNANRTDTNPNAIRQITITRNPSNDDGNAHDGMHYNRQTGNIQNKPIDDVRNDQRYQNQEGRGNRPLVITYNRSYDDSDYQNRSADFRNNRQISSNRSMDETEDRKGQNIETRNRRQMLSIQHRSIEEDFQRGTNYDSRNNRQPNNRSIDEEDPYHGLVSDSRSCNRNIRGFRNNYRVSSSPGREIMGGNHKDRSPSSKNKVEFQQVEIQVTSLDCDHSDQIEKEMYKRRCDCGLGRSLEVEDEDDLGVSLGGPMSRRAPCPFKQDSGVCCWEPCNCCPDGDHIGNDRQFSCDDQYHNIDCAGSERWNSRRSGTTLTVQRASSGGNPRLLRKQSSGGSVDSGQHSICSPFLSRDNSTEQVGGEMINPAEIIRFIKDTLNKSYRDRVALLKIEQAMVNLVRDPTRREHRFTPMSSYGRLLTHRCAELFNLRHYLDSQRQNVIQQSTLPNQHQIMTVYKPPHGSPPCKIPSVSPFQQWCSVMFQPPSPTNFCEPPPQAKSILKRDAHSLDEDAVVIAPSRNQAPPRSKSFEQREEEYEKARRRIFKRDEDGQESWEWEGPKGDGDADTKPKQLLAPENKQGRLLKVHSLEQRAPPCCGARNPVSKAHSFGGYGERALPRGDSVYSSHSAPPPPTRILSSQGELARSSWRLSPSSSGCTGVSGRSDSVTSPTPGANPTDTITANSGSGPAGGLLWAITDMAAVPPGALIIHPRTGQPLTNSDGSLYHYDPARPPNSALLIPAQGNIEGIRVLTNPERRRSRLEKQRATLSPGTEPDSNIPVAASKIENTEGASQTQSKDQPLNNNLSPSMSNNSLDVTAGKAQTCDCNDKDSENKTPTIDYTPKVVTENKSSEFQTSTTVSVKGTSPGSDKSTKNDFHFDPKKLTDNSNSKNQATSPNPPVSVIHNISIEGTANKENKEIPSIRGADKTKTANETIKEKREANHRMSPKTRYVNRPAIEDTSIKAVIQNQYYKNNRKEPEEYSYEKKSILDQISPDTLTKFAHLGQFEYYNNTLAEAKAQLETTEAYEALAEDRRENYAMPGYPDMHGSGYYAPHQAHYYDQENIYDPSSQEAHQYMSPQPPYHALPPAPLVYPGPMPYSPQPELLYQGPPPPILVQSPYRIPEQAVAHPYMVPEPQVLMALNPKPPEQEGAHCYQDSILGAPQVPYQVPGTTGWGWPGLLYSTQVPSPHLPNTEDMTQKMQSHHVPGAYIPHAAEPMNPTNMATVPPGFYQPHLVQHPPSHYYPYGPHPTQVLHPLPQAQYPLYRYNPGRSSVHSQESDSPGYQQQYDGQINAFVYPKVTEQDANKFNQIKSPKTTNSRGASNSGSSRATPLTAGIPMAPENYPNMDVNFVNGLNNLHFMQQPVNYAAYPYSYQQECVSSCCEPNIKYPEVHNFSQLNKNIKLYKDVNSTTTPRDSPIKKNDAFFNKNRDFSDKKAASISSQIEKGIENAVKNTEYKSYPKQDTEPTDDADSKNSNTKDRQRDAFKNSMNLSILNRDNSFDHGVDSQNFTKSQTQMLDEINENNTKIPTHQVLPNPTTQKMEPPKTTYYVQPSEQEKINAMKIITSTLSNTAKSFIPKTQNTTAKQPPNAHITNNFDNKMQLNLEQNQYRPAAAKLPDNIAVSSVQNSSVKSPPAPAVTTSDTSVKRSQPSVIIMTSPSTVNTSLSSSPYAVSPPTIMPTSQNTANVTSHVSVTNNSPKVTAVSSSNSYIAKKSGTGAIMNSQYAVVVTSPSAIMLTTSNSYSTNTSNYTQAESARISWNRQQSFNYNQKNNYNNFPRNINRQNREYRNSDRQYRDRSSPRNRSNDRNFQGDSYNNNIRMQQSFDLPQSPITPTTPIMSQPFAPWNQRMAPSPGNNNYRQSDHGSPTSLMGSNPPPHLATQTGLQPAMAVAAAINRAAENLMANSRNTGMGLIQSPPALQGQLLFRQLPGWTRRLPTPALFGPAPSLVAQPRVRTPRPHSHQTHFYR